MTSSVLQLYVLGSLDRDGNRRTLTIFAEYKALRGLSRVELTKIEVDELASSIGALRGYVEGGFPTIDQKTLRSIGTRLFNILITDRTEKLFLLATGENKATGGDFLPLEIVAEDFEIAGWPWEYLYSSSDKRFIAQDFHPVSRSIFSMSSRSLPPKKGRIHILVILGVPPDDPYTTPKEEIKVITEVFQAQLGDSNFNLEVLPASDYKRLRGLISTRTIDIVHYFGHAGFDDERGQGFLSIARVDAGSFKIYAEDFARLLMASGVRLVFLNACKTAQGSQNENPGRSSVAATLIDAGIPAVIGTQFSLPDVSAHSLSATIYNELLLGKPIGEAVRVGRNAMFFAEKAAFFDWGIPVLYSTDAAQIIFPSAGDGDERARNFDQSVGSSPRPFAGTSIHSKRQKGSPVVVERTRSTGADKIVKVALLDIDSMFGFLPDLARLVNEAQDYYNFEVVYVPVPSGYVRADLGNNPQTFVPRLEKALKPLLKELHVDFICGLTQHPVAGKENGEEYWDYFASSLTESDQIFMISTFDLRRYAKKAKVSFTKAVFWLCRSMLVECDSRWNIQSHEETRGCLFDLCENRSDIVVGLKKMKFDHKKCRSKIKDLKQLAAIDRLFAINFSEL